MAKKITFSLAPEIVADATEGILLGDFNNWLHESGFKLKKQKDGSLKATVELEPGIYQYRYFLNDGRWVNDGNAQGYSFVGEYGVDNCVISIPLEEVKETLAKGELVTDVDVKAKKAATYQKSYRN
jgi:1,4-alpha-glucan branching enzyme